MVIARAKRYRSRPRRRAARDRQAAEPGLTPFPFPETDLAAITAPTFLIFGDADIVTLNHALDLFALLGGPRNGDMEGLSPHRLAILPATTHTAVFLRTELLVDLVGPFLAGEAPRTMMAQ